MFEPLFAKSEIFRDNIKLLQQVRLRDLLRGIHREETNMAATIEQLDAELTTVIGDEATTEQVVGQILDDLKAKQGQPSPDFQPEVDKLTALDSALKNMATKAQADDPAGTAAGSGSGAGTTVGTTPGTPAPTGGTTGVAAATEVTTEGAVS